MIRLYLVRHADAYDEMGIQLENSPLNNYGRIQALQLAKRFKQNKFDVMYCSKIRRSIETCQIVNEEHDMEVRYIPGLNEVGDESWPQPGVLTSPTTLEDFNLHMGKIHEIYRKILREHRCGENEKREIIIFTHGNWIRVLLSKILGKGDPETFVHFVIANSSLTIIDVDHEGFEHIITVSDAAHTHLYETRI